MRREIEEEIDNREINWKGDGILQVQHYQLDSNSSNKVRVIFLILFELEHFSVGGQSVHLSLNRRHRLQGDKLLIGYLFHVHLDSIDPTIDLGI